MSSNSPPLPASSSKETGSSSPKGQLFCQFTIAEIRSATQDFNESLLIGRGRFWKVYKGTIKNGTQTIVALKRWNSGSSQGVQEFLVEVDLLPTLVHPNIVCLIGYCLEGEETILAYEYMSNGSLRDHLHKHNTPLSWSQRLKICIDVAHALDYLHNGTNGQQVIYNNVKSSNILLDNRWAAKIKDFGLSKIIPTEKSSIHVSTAIAGTFGYLDPEYCLTGRLSKKSDVYSFGVVLLEVLCRRRAVDLHLPEEQQALVRWAQDYLRTGKVEQIIDPNLRGQISLKCLNDYVRIVECCLRDRQEPRITMSEVLFGLESIVALHERTDHSIPQMGITADDWKLQKYFFSSGESDFGKDIEPLSPESYRHEGEYDPMTETDVSAKSEGSYQLEKSIKQSIWFSSWNFDQASEPNRQIVDEKLVSGDGTKSLYKTVQLEYIQRADVLMRMKDLLHLIWFYPVKKEAEVNFRSLVDKCSSLNEYIRKSLNSSRDSNYVMETLLLDIEEHLDAATFDMVAYVPEGLVQNGSRISKSHDIIKTLRLVRCPKCRKVLPEPPDVRVYKCGSCGAVLQAKKNKPKSDTVGTTSERVEEVSLSKRTLELVAEDQQEFQLETVAKSGQVPFASFWSGIPEVHASAIASATQQAISCITDLKVKKLGISGRGSQEVATTLKHLTELTRAFDMVLCVHVKHGSIKELMSDIEEEIHLWRKRSSETSNKINVLDETPNCLLFVDCRNTYIDLHDPEFNFSKWFGNVQIVITSRSQNTYCPVDTEISIEDHLLPWILFSINFELATVGNFPSIQRMARRLVKKCHGHLLAIILLARALRGMVNVSTWELALDKLEEPSSSQLDIGSDVMVKVLRFIWSQMETLSQRCIIQFASRYIGSEYEKYSLIHSWIRDGLAKSVQEGEHAFEDLKRSFLLEQVREYCVRMRDEIRIMLVAYFVPRAHGLYIKQDGSESSRMPNIEEWDAREIHLSNNIVSELPDNPDCPILVKLFLHFNEDLVDIPITFFNNMPGLQVLDLSSTSINCLPSSISKLTTLRELFIRYCDSLMELPSEIGALKNLKVFDSEGTQLICLPEQFGWLIKLECLKFSLYTFADKQKQSIQSMQTMSASVLSKLIRLKELSICVDLYREWWENEVKLIIDILPKVRNLESFRLYIPSTELLEIFMGTQNWRGSPIYQSLSNFGLVVGHLQQRLISRVPHDLHKTFVKMPKCLKYTNGEGNTEVIARALTHANALFLDRHWTVRSLSAFGLAAIDKLKFCLLAECNEIVEIVNGSSLEDYPTRSVLGSLEHLSIHYMKSLTCILNGPIDSVCLPNLKTLAIHTCPELSTIFTQGLLESLTCLEYLIVKDCAKIKSLVSSESYQSTSTPCLPSLKKISLLHLPELVSISRGISIAPRLESLVIYNCPNLEKLPYMEDSYIKEIKGKNEWWDALKWCEPEWTSGQPDYLANLFVPLGTNGGIVAELANAVNLLPHLSN